MSEHAHTGAGEDRRSHPRTGSELTLRHMVERGIQAMAEEGRTTARWLAEIDHLRAQGLLPSLTAEQRARAIEESRVEREARYDEWLH